MGGTKLLIKTYMDESGVHDGAPVTAVGAYFSNDKTWKHFTRRWLHVLREFGLTEFHMNDYVQRRNAFKCWSTGDQRALGKKLFPLIPRHTKFGVSVAMNHHEFEEVFAVYPNIRKGLGEPYTCCFQWLILLVVERVTMPDPSWRIGCTHEDNDYKGDAIAAWDWVRKKENGRHLGVLAFAPKTECVPLQAADVLAWETQKLLADPGRPERKSMSVLRANITVQTITKKWLMDNGSRLDGIVAEELRRDEAERVLQSDRANPVGEPAEE